jgi:hypothetical protein
MQQHFNFKLTFLSNVLSFIKPSNSSVTKLKSFLATLSTVLTTSILMVSSGSWFLDLSCSYRISFYSVFSLSRFHWICITRKTSNNEYEIHCQLFHLKSYELKYSLHFSGSMIFNQIYACSFRDHCICIFNLFPFFLQWWPSLISYQWQFMHVLTHIRELLCCLVVHNLENSI